MLATNMRYQPLPSELFINNRQRLAACLPAGSIAVLHSNDIYPTNADGTMSFKQNSNLYYLSGIDQEESMLILWPDATDANLREVLFVKETNETIAIWEGAKLSKQQATELSGIQNVQWNSSFESLLAQIIKQAEQVYLPLNEHLRADSGVETKELRFARQLKQQYPLHDFRRLAPIINRLRQVKQPAEIVTMQKACDITRDGFHRLLGFIKPGVGEWEVEAELSHEFLRQGSRGFAYAPIIAGGSNSLVLHYVDNDKVLGDGDLVLLDVGAEYANYNADLTRTIPVNGKFSPRQRQVYDAVLRVLRGANQILQPGIYKKDYEAQVGLLIDEELIGLGLLTREQVAGADSKNPPRRRYFMHGCSHFLGIDVHDVGEANPLIEEGMVFTIEPGIYIAEEGIGIRIENDVLVKAGGNIDLMAGIAIEADEIEALMASRA